MVNKSIVSILRKMNSMKLVGNHLKKVSFLDQTLIFLEKQKKIRKNKQNLRDYGAEQVETVYFPR